MRVDIKKHITCALSLSLLLVACGSSSGQGAEGGGDPWGSGGAGGAIGDGGIGGGGIGGNLPACNTGSAQLLSDVFDPNQVYLAGTLEEGACWKGAFAHWSSPDTYVGQFECIIRKAQIRPSDGRLLYMMYTNGSEILQEFRCDGCAGGGESPDPVIATPPCSAIAGFLVSPTGETLYGCPSGWYDGNKQVVFEPLTQDNVPIHLGYGGLALTRTRIVDLPTGKWSPIVGLPKTLTGEPTPIYAIRAREPRSFLLVIMSPNSDGNSQELWEVGENGLAVKLGVYPPLPASAKGVYADTSQLEPCGALVQRGTGMGVFQDIIVRREFGGASAVVYDEANGPTVMSHGSDLVTGP